jgi:hypothetical protein
MKLSKNLSLTEAIKSNTAIRNGIDNEPTKKHLENLILISKKVFQPIRDHFNIPIYVSSGYRSKALNKLVGGSQTSHHSTGQALDIDMDGRRDITNLDIFNFVKDNLDFTQLILEYPNKEGNPAWVHIGYVEGNLKKQILVSYRDSGRTRYKIWS